MVTTLSYIAGLVFSALWFAAAFRYFSFQHYAAAKVFVPRSARSSPIFPTIAVATRFLGGMNAAFSALSFILLLLVFASASLFVDPLERVILLTVLGLAHFSQFIFNVPIWKNGGRQGETYWDVTTGPMKFIFVMDAIGAVLCLVCAVVVLIAAY